MGGPREHIIRRRRKRDPVTDLDVAGNSGGFEFLPSLQQQAKSKLGRYASRYGDVLQRHIGMHFRTLQL
jgi:hypothetical protein